MTCFTEAQLTLEYKEVLQMAYDIALLIHIFAVIATFVALALEWVIMLTLRRADNVAAARMWVAYTAPLGPIYGIVCAVLIATGLYMLHDDFADTQPWALISLALMIALLIVGGLVNGTRFDAIRHGLQAAPDGGIPDDIAKRIGDPVLYTSIQVVTGQMLAIMMLMTLKPGLRDSLLTIALLALVALGVSLPAWRARHAAPGSLTTAHR